MQQTTRLGACFPVAVQNVSLVGINFGLRIISQEAKIPLLVRDAKTWIIGVKNYLKKLRS